MSDNPTNDTLTERLPTRELLGMVIRLRGAAEISRMLLDVVETAGLNKDMPGYASTKERIELVLKDASSLIERGLPTSLELMLGQPTDSRI